MPQDGFGFWMYNLCVMLGFLIGLLIWCMIFIPLFVETWPW